MASTVTTFMLLIVPTLLNEPGPTYALDVNTSLGLIDVHDHSPGKGTKITPAGINVVADLSMKGSGSAGNNLTDARTVRFESQGAALSGSNDKRAIYSVGNDLFFNDGNGVQIQLTVAGAVNVSSAGSITGMGATTATVTYSNVTKTFVFAQSAGVAAKMDFGDLALRDTTTPFNAVTLKAPLGLAAGYTLTLPAALPAAANTTIWSVDNTGAVAFSLAPVFTARPTFSGMNPGNTADVTAGNIRYNGAVLQGFEGGAYKNLIGWDYLGGTAPLGANATTLGLVTIAARDILMIVAWLPNNGANSSNVLMRFNNDSAGNYAWRQARMSGGTGTWAETTGTSATSMQIGQEALNAACSIDLEMIIGNKATLMKPVQISVGNNDSGSAATAPAISLGSALWSNVAAQITQIEIFSSVANGLGIGACFAVFGRNA